MRINFNVSSIVAKNALAKNDARFSASTLRLSSGYKINKASDNAAGLAIARKMNAQIRGIVRANENANDGISVVNTADGAMMEMHNILQRMNELSIQAANGTNSDDDRAKIQLEIDQLVKEIDRIADTTQFNAQPLLDGTFAYKGYTNTENVRVMTSTDGVTSGTYAIKNISYDSVHKKVTTYGNNGTTVRNIEEKDTFDLGKADDIRKALVKADELDDYKQADSAAAFKAFPEDSLVSVDNEYLVIKSKGDFEIKLAVNSQNAIDADGLATTEKTLAEDYANFVYKDIEITSDLMDTTKTPPRNKTYKLGEIRIEDVAVVDKDSFTDIATALTDYFADKKESDVEIKKVVIKKRSIEITYDSTIDAEKKENQKLTFDFKDSLATKDTLDFKNIEITTDLMDETANPPIPKTYKLGEIKVSEEVADDVKDESLDGIATALKEYFAENNKNAVEIESAVLKNSSIVITYRSEGIDTPQRLECKFTDPLATRDTYLSAKEEIQRTTYTVGKTTPNDPNVAITLDDFIAVNISGMGPMRVQVGANEGQYIDIEIPDLNTLYLGIDKLSVRTEDDATKSIDIVGKAIGYLSSVRAKIGAYANRLEETVKNLETTEENMTASYSRVMDVDMAKEMSEYTTVQVLVQASTSMLAQANQRPQQVLQLLQ